MDFLVMFVVLPILAVVVIVAVDELLDKIGV